MKISKRLVRKSLIGITGLMAMCALLALAAWIFAVFARWWAGVDGSTLALASYSNPTPEPGGNFFSSLGFDFRNPVDGNYRAHQVVNLSLRPQLKGQIERNSPEAVPWPFDPVLAHTVDLDASAKAIRQLAEQTVTHAAGEESAYLRNLLKTKNAKELGPLFLQPFRPYLQDIYASLPEPKSIYPAPSPLQATLDTPTLKVFDLIAIFQLLALDQLLDFDSSGKNSSAKPLLAAFRISEGIFQRPVGLFSFVGGCAACSFSFPLLWQGVEGNHFSESSTLALLRQLEELEPMKNVESVIGQETAWRFQFMEWTALREPWWKRIFMVPFAKVWQGVFLLNLAEIQKELKKNSVFKKKPTEPQPFFWNLYNVLYPRNAIDVYNEAQYIKILLHLAQLDLALDFFIRKNGEAPNHLNALVPTILPVLPQDPFSKKNFSYRKTAATSYLLYSCWIDGKDDGGIPVTIPQPPPKDIMEFLRHRATGDLVWPPHHAGKN